MVTIAGQRSRPSMSRWRASSALWLLSIAMFLRVLVPAGYMLDSNALSDGRIELSFCTAAGDISTISMSLSVNTNGASHHGGSADTDDACPFCLFNHVAMAMPEAGVLSALPYKGVPVILLGAYYRALPALPAQGPPLGARAPPSLLG